MPIWLRRFTFEKIKEFYEKERENMEKQNKTLVALVILLALAVLSLGLVVSQQKVVETEKIVTVNVPVLVSDNATQTKLDKLLEDDNFEVVALGLAKSDLEAKAYKDLYNAMKDANISIDEKEDISKVVVKDSDVSGVDVKDGDADVTLELKVYFEDLDGDDKKIYVTVNSEVIDSEVEDVEYVFA
jgi:hypothetical protein